MLFVRLRARLHPEKFAFVDNQLPILAEDNLKAIQWPRRRTFEIHAALVKAAAEAGTFEFFLCGEPARSAAQMRTLGKQRVYPFIFANNPHAVVLFELFTDLAKWIV